MSAHTPGPWALNGVMALDTPLWIVSIPGEQARIEVADYSAESEGNARLIAAAPDLLAALEWALPFAEKYENTFPGGPRQQLMEAKLAEVRAALAKAKGKS